MYIIIEGPNYSGKTTFINKVKESNPGKVEVLKQELDDNFYKCWEVYKNNADINPLLDWHLDFFIDKIYPVEKEGKISIIDRFFPSISVYQSVHPYLVMKHSFLYGDWRLVILPSADIDEVFARHVKRHGELEQIDRNLIISSQYMQKERYVYLRRIVEKTHNFRLIEPEMVFKLVSEQQ